MGETHSENGISRRELLKKGAVLGGAVAWATPVVQTLGMGRAFAQTASPTGGKDISYIGINVNCDDAKFWIKWEDGGWEDAPGAAPECAEKDDLPNGVNGTGLGFQLNPGPTSACRQLVIPDAYAKCNIEVWVKAGSSQSTPEPCAKYNYTPGDNQTFMVCSSTT